MRYSVGDRVLLGGARVGVLAVPAVAVTLLGALLGPGLVGALAPPACGTSPEVFAALGSTLLTSLAAVVLGGVPGVVVAVYLAELGPPRPCRVARGFFAVATAVPAAVYGLCAVWYLAPGLGLGLGVASLALAAMTLPTVTLLALGALRRVPVELREASAALGATPWQTAWGVVFPAARRGLAGAVLVGSLRAVGESVAVAMVLPPERDTLAASLLRAFLDTPRLPCGPPLSLALTLLTLSTLGALLVHRTAPAEPSPGHGSTPSGL